MFNLYHWEVFHRLRIEDAAARHEQARLLADAKRSGAHGAAVGRALRPGLTARALWALGGVLIAAGRRLQGRLRDALEEPVPAAGLSGTSAGPEGTHQAGEGYVYV
jgi:hypothetical protein